MPLRSPLILDLDGGVLPLPQAQTLALPQWHDPLRFACGNATLHRFAAEVLAPLPAQRRAGGANLHRVFIVGPGSVLRPAARGRGCST